MSKKIDYDELMELLIDRQIKYNKDAHVELKGIERKPNMDCALGASTVLREIITWVNAHAEKED